MEPDLSTADTDLGSEEGCVASAQIDPELSTAVHVILRVLGYDLGDANFKKTPIRVARWLQEYQAPKDLNEEIEKVLQPVFPSEFDELVMVRDISFTSLCAHHLLPFRGVASVGYIPAQGVVGISKLARVARLCAARATLQEQITIDIANGIDRVLRPKGVMVVLQAEHQCMTIRGVRDPGCQTVTSAVRGVFLNNTKGSKDEFLRLLERRS